MNSSTSTIVYILGLEGNFRGLELNRLLSLNEMNVVIHHGFDGNLNTAPQHWRDDKRSIRLYRKVLSNQEIACSYGHRQMVHSAVGENCDFTLFLEDDVTCVSVPKLNDFLSTAMSDEPVIWTFPLAESEDSTNFRFVSRCRLLVEKLSSPSGAFAYLMNNQALNAVEQGFNRYGFQGYVADFPTFFPDFIKFKRGATGIFALRDVESVLGDLPSRSRPSPKAIDFVKFFGDLLFINWILSFYRDCGPKGFFQIRHINLMVKTFNFFSRFDSR